MHLKHMPARYRHQCLRFHDSLSHFQSPLQRGLMCGKLQAGAKSYMSYFKKKTYITYHLNQNTCVSCCGLCFEQIWHLISVRAHGPPQRGFPAMLARGSGRGSPQASVDGNTPSKAAWELHMGLYKRMAYQEE